MGKNTFFSDGTTATRVGKNTFFSDGAVATQVGKNTFISGGDCEIGIKAIAIPSLFDEE